MARTIMTQLYKFEELIEEAQERAINDYRNVTQKNGFTWQEENRQTLESFIKIFPVKLDRRGEGLTFISSEALKDKDHNILSGQRLATYLWNNYRNELFSGKYYSKGLKNRRSNCILVHECELTGYYLDENILKPIYDHMNNPDPRTDFEDLMNSCFSEWKKSVQKDQEFQLSDEYIKEEIETNEYEFTEKGERF